MAYDHKKFSAKRCWVERFNCYVDSVISFHFAGSIMYRVTVGNMTEFVVQESDCSRFSY